MSTTKEPTLTISQYQKVDAEEMNDESKRPSNYTSSNESQSKLRRKCRSSTVSWFWETIAMVASAACLIAVVVILARMHSKPLDRWTLDISLNATVAIFITAAKSLALLVIGACIAQSKWIRFKTAPRRLDEFDLFENAARGPLGSLMLLLQVRWHSGFASVGAILTILALGVDTFAQQVIRLDTKSVEVMDGGASFGLSRNYTGGAKWLMPYPGDIEAKTVDVAMEGAVFRGIYNISSNPNFHCGSTCIWHDSYISLGLASQCKDVTTETLASNANTTSNQTYNRGIYALTTPGNISIGMHFESLVENEEDPPSAYFSELEIFECTLGFAAYNYTTLSASGNRLEIEASSIKLEPGIVSGRPGSQVTYKQSGLPAFVVQEADIRALVNLFESSRFSGNVTSGQIPVALPSGVVMALLSSNITQTFDNVAASMTEQLRSSSSDVARGITVTLVVFVHIEWAWLGLPVAVTFVSGLFLLATWMHARLHHCVPWKSSAVAILYHQVVVGVDEKAVVRSEMRGLKEMEYAAKRTKATLE
ncbi:hypothetical protein EK21DRAFT_118279 [Setomelanomma holmii]|uniref:Uncharacterized protein n=1 Tax=Setomelanomma holmii TaxID=210430 RepID=A0A9P4GZE6_9PLEO|nr:hypothetical protein EK21DRAFT_118279 [Setomelanomma holmii]